MKAHLARIAALAALIMVLAISSPALAQQSGIGVVSTLSGQATVARLPLPQPVPLRFKDNVFGDDRISTAERSTVRVLLGGKALVTVRELSVLTITENVGRSTINLTSGKIAVGVARRRMSPGETIEIRTANAIAAVRGTVLVVEVVGATPPTTNVHVLHGLVDVSPGNVPGGPALQIGSLQSFIGTPGGFGQMRALTPEAAQALFADLQSDPQFVKGSDAFLASLETREQERAAALALVINEARGARHGSGGGCSGGDCNVVNNGITPCTTGSCSGAGGSGGNSGGAAKSGKAVTTYKNQTVNISGDFLHVPKAGNVNLARPLLETTATTLNVAASLTAQKLVDVNSALLDASAPLLILSGNSAFTSKLDAVDLGGVNAATRFPSVASLNGSIMTIKSGAGLNLTGGSTAAVTADLFSLANRSVLTIMNGPLLSLAGGSTLTISGALLNFIGVGNTVSITNSLCGGACQLISGIPVFIRGGATVSITSPIKNAAGNTITYSSPSAALVSVAGGQSTLTVLGK